MYYVLCVQLKANSLCIFIQGLVGVKINLAASEMYTFQICVYQTFAAYLRNWYEVDVNWHMHMCREQHCDIQCLYCQIIPDWVNLTNKAEHVLYLAEIARVIQLIEVFLPERKCFIHVSRG